MPQIIEADYENLDLGEIPQSFWEGFPQVSGLSVFVKPNMVIPPSEWEQASTTRLEVVRLVVQKLIQEGCKEIIIGDCGFKFQWAVTVVGSGYVHLAEEFEQVRLVGLQETENFNRYSLYRAPQGKYLSLYGARLSDIATACDTIINIPKMKIHKMAYITGAIKNMMGIMTQKGSMHPNGRADILHKRLRDLYFLTRGFVGFCVLDGIEGSEYAETGGIPVNSNILCSGIDPWEIDVILAKLVGIKPQLISYLEYIRRDLKREFKELEVPEHLIKSYELPLGLRE